MDPWSLCQCTCCKMHITGGQQGPFWTAVVKDTVKHSMINKQYTNAMSGCKRVFQGKSGAAGV
jgi:hypothetical protein